MDYIKTIPSLLTETTKVIPTWLNNGTSNIKNKFMNLFKPTIDKVDGILLMTDWELDDKHLINCLAKYLKQCNKLDIPILVVVGENNNDALRYKTALVEFEMKYLGFKAVQVLMGISSKKDYPYEHLHRRYAGIDQEKLDKFRQWDDGGADTVKEFIKTYINSYCLIAKPPYEIIDIGHEYFKQFPVTFVWSAGDNNRKMFQSSKYDTESIKNEKSFIKKELINFLNSGLTIHYFENKLCFEKELVELIIPPSDCTYSSDYQKYAKILNIHMIDSIIEKLINYIQITPFNTREMMDILTQISNLYKKTITDDTKFSPELKSLFELSIVTINKIQKSKNIDDKTYEYLNNVIGIINSFILTYEIPIKMDDCLMGLFIFPDSSTINYTRTPALISYDDRNYVIIDPSIKSNCYVYTDIDETEFKTFTIECGA